MNILLRLVCDLRGHRWGRAKRIVGTDGERTCNRCGLVQAVSMKTPYARKREAVNRG